MYYDALVIGAGPSGSRVAWRLAEANLKVALVEEDSIVGEPCQCAGLVTPRTIDYLGYDIPILGEMNGARLWGPQNSFLEFQANETKALVINRPDLDRSIADKAVSAGAVLMTNTQYLGFSRIDSHLKVTLQSENKTIELETELIIGSDGPASRVARDAELQTSREVLAAFGGDVEGLTTKENHVELFVGSEVAPRFFAWIIPTGESTGRLGLATSLPSRPKKYFWDLFKKGAPSALLENAKIVNRISGLIPFGLRNPAYSDNVILTGDAAGMAKPTSGGGIYSGLVSADAAADTAILAFQKGNLSASTLKRYQFLIESDFAKELKLGSYLRRAFVELSDSQLAEIINSLNDPKIKKTIQEYGDLDYASAVAFAVLKVKPQMIKFAPLLLKPFV